MRHYTFIFCCLLLMGCKTENETKIQTTEEIIEQIRSEFPGAKNEPLGERRIQSFTKFQFLQERKTLMEEGEEHDYQFSDVKEVGDTFKYTVKIPGVAASFEYSCNPKKGELTTSLAGEREAANLFYNQTKVSLEWDNCNKEADAEYCEKYQNMESEPLKTHFTASIVHSESASIYIFRRVTSLR